jgi:D-arabinitol 2-dehydrogenase
LYPSFSVDALLANKQCSVPKVTAHYSDVSNEEWVDIAINEVLEAHGKIDHLVTSAGFTENIPALEYPIGHMRRLFDVNVLGTYLFAVAVTKHLIARKAPGSMVFIGSMSGAIVNLPQRQTPYNASKAAVRHMAASLAVEWAQYGIRVNCISPGYMTTPL